MVYFKFSVLGPDVDFSLISSFSKKYAKLMFIPTHCEVWTLSLNTHLYENQGNAYFVIKCNEQWNVM